MDSQSQTLINNNQIWSQPLGLSKKLSTEKLARYKDSELKNGRAAMIAMASMFAFESIPGSVPLMDLFGAN
jgi:hypothetical protein